MRPRSANLDSLLQNTKGNPSNIRPRSGKFGFLLYLLSLIFIVCVKAVVLFFWVCFYLKFIVELFFWKYIFYEFFLLRILLYFLNSDKRKLFLIRFFFKCFCEISCFYFFLFFFTNFFFGILLRFFVELFCLTLLQFQI